MTELYSAEEQADSFASSFPEPDRATVKEWYLAQLEVDRRDFFWKQVEAGLTVFVLAGVLPTIALWAYIQLS
ncbi:MAG: hypothetical protein AB1918_06250 [Pseudomonadota bacterium]